MKSHSSILAIVFGLLLLNLFFMSTYLNYFIIFSCFLSLVSEKISKIIEKFWIKLSLLLNMIFPKIILTTIFFLVLTPLAVFSKIFNAKTNYISFNNSKSMFKLVNKSFPKESFKKTY